MKKLKMALFIGMILCGVTFLASKEVIEEIVAIVNDDIISLSEYKQRHDALVQELRAQLRGQQFEEQYGRLKEGLLDTMITELLLRQLAKERNMDVSEQVRLTVERIKTENNIESDEELKRLLQNQGYDYNLMLKQMEETFLMQSVVFSEVDRTIAIDDSEIIEYYKLHSAEFTEPEEFRLRAIYLSPENKTGDELEAKKKEIEDKIQAGEDFGVLAGNYSEGPAKESQGDLGTFKKGELDKSLEQAVALLKQGEITPWIQSRGGWYLVRIEEKKESRLLSFEEAKKTIEEKIFNERKTSKLNEFLKELKQKSYIKIVNSDPLKISGQEA